MFMWKKCRHQNHVLIIFPWIKKIGSEKKAKCVPIDIFHQLAAFGTFYAIRGETNLCIKKPSKTCGEDFFLLVKMINLTWSQLVKWKHSWSLRFSTEKKTMNRIFFLFGSITNKPLIYLFILCSQKRWKSIQEWKKKWDRQKNSDRYPSIADWLCVCGASSLND